MRKLIVSCGRVVSLECAFGTLMMVLLSSSSFTAQTAPSAAPPKQAPATPQAESGRAEAGSRREREDR